MQNTASPEIVHQLQAEKPSCGYNPTSLPNQDVQEPSKARGDAASRERKTLTFYDCVLHM